MGIDGLIDERGIASGGMGDGEKNGLRLALNNPADQAVDIALRMASSGNLAAPWRREESNTFVEGLDLPWELSTLHTLRHLEAGGKDGWAIDLTREGEIANVGGPPQVEIVVHFSDSHSETREVVLKRRVAVAPRVDVPIVAAVPGNRAGTEGWENAASGSAYAWEIRGDEPKKLAPTWQMTADVERLYLRIRVDDSGAWFLAEDGAGRKVGWVGQRCREHRVGPGDRGSLRRSGAAWFGWCRLGLQEALAGQSFGRIGGWARSRPHC